MAHRLSRAHWYADLRSGESKPYAVRDGQRVWVTHAKLVDPASAPAGQTVRVALRTRTGDDESLVLSAERPRARVQSTEILEDEFWLERDEDGSADAVVRFRGLFVNLLAPETVEDEDGEEDSDVEDDDDGEVVRIEDGEDMVEEYEATDDEMSYDGDGITDDVEEDEHRQDQDAVLEVQEDDGAEAAGLEDDVGMAEEYDPEESNDADRITDHEGDEEESDGEFEVHGEYDFDVSVADQVHPRFLGGSARRFAATGSTAGFMWTTAADAVCQGGGDNDRQILVHYRYTCFSAASFDGGVEAFGSTMEHQLRFIADGGHGARSLAWAGASLVPLIYPRHSRNRFRKLWSRLIAGVSIQPHATRVEVFVEVGILRPADSTPARLTHMCDTLKDMMAQPWPEGFMGMELQLPEPVRCGHEDDGNDTNGEERPAKRRRVAAAGEPVRCDHGEDDDNDTEGEKRPAKQRRVVAAGDNCTVCLELLEGDDLGAWPGCGKPHVFHGRCLELLLEKSDTCPICRRSLFT